MSNRAFGSDTPPKESVPGVPESVLQKFLKVARQAGAGDSTRLQVCKLVKEDKRYRMAGGKDGAILVD